MRVVEDNKTTDKFRYLGKWVRHSGVKFVIKIIAKDQPRRRSTHG